MSFTTDDFKSPKQRLTPEDAGWNPNTPRASSSSCNGGSSYARGGSYSGGSNLTSSPGTDCTRRSTQNSPTSYSFNQSSYHGSQDDLEADFEEISTERMESLVSGLLQDEGWEHQNSCPVLPPELLRTGGDISRGPSVEAASRIQELQMQYQDRCASNSFFGPGGDKTFYTDCLGSDNGSAGGRYPSTESLFPSEETHDQTLFKECEPPLCASFLGMPADVSNNVNLSYLSGSLRNGIGHVKPNMMCEHQQQMTRKILEDITRRNEALVSLCRLLYETGCPTLNAELDKVKNDIREANQLRSLAPNFEPMHSYPTAGHLRSQRTLGTGFSSPMPTIVNDPTSAKSCNSSAAGVRSALSGPPIRGRRQENSHVRSRRPGTTPGKKPDGDLCNSDSPPKRRTSTRSKPGLARTSRAVDNNLQAKIVAPTGCRPRTPTSVSPSLKCAGNQHAATLISSATKEYPSFQTPLPDQKGSKYHAAFAGKDHGSSDANPVELQNGPATKALIAQGAKSISVLLKPETTVSRGRCSYPASSCRNGSDLVSPGSVSLSSIRRLELHVSDADALQHIPIQHPSLELDVSNQGQFKTELCNNWQAAQYCRYGDHCRFAHGVEELRCVLRHPRYKSVPCRMIMHGLPCIYGHRCHFRHSLTAEELSLISIVDVHDASVHERFI